MRVLSVRQPWAWAIIHGGKTVENRTRNIAGDYRGPVLIHVAKAYADGWQSRVLSDLMNGHPGVYEDPQPWRDHAGEIVGVVDLVDVHVGPEYGGGCHLLGSPLPVTPTYARCSEWGEPGSYHLVLENPRALDEPIPYRGALGLRKTDFGVEGDWLVEYHEPCNYPCAGPYGCPPSCHMDPISRLVATT